MYSNDLVYAAGDLGDDDGTGGPTIHSVSNNGNNMRGFHRVLPSNDELYREQVHLKNDASEVDILGHSGTFWINSEDFMMSLEHLEF